MANVRFADVKTAAGDSLALVSFEGQEGLATPFSFELRLSSDDPDLDLSSMLGTAASIALELPGGELRHFHGLVASFGREPWSRHRMIYRATLRPWLSMLSFTADCRIFQQMSAPDVIKQVFRDGGFSDFDECLTGSYPVRDYIVQYRESAFNFVSRLMEEEGIYYFFSHAEEKHVLVMADSYSAHEPAAGYEEVPYYPPTSSGLRERDHLDSWTSQRTIRSGSFMTTDYDFQRPKASMEVKAASPRTHEHADYEIYDYPGEYVEVQHGDAIARVRLQARQAAHHVFSGGGNARGLGAGALFSLRGHPAESQNIEYLVVTSEYRGTSGEAASGGGETPAFVCHLSAIESNVAFRPRQRASKPSVVGPQTAVVVGPGGEEIWTDEYARVKVQFHWDREGKNDENSSCWVRVAQYWAGAGFGSIHIPRIGQEVIVDFLEGDPDRPIITGRVYNADNMPPYGLPGNATQSGWKSRSTKGGNPDNCNEIRFEDELGGEQLYVQAEKNMDTLVKDAQTLSVGSTRAKQVGTHETSDIGESRTETVGTDESIKIGGDRTEEVSGDETIGIQGSRKEDVTGDESVTIGGSRIAKVGGSESITIGASQSVDVVSSVSRSIGTTETVDIKAARSTQVGAADSLTVIGALAVDVGAAMSTSVGAVSSLQVAGNHSESIDGGRSANVKGDCSFQIGGNHSVTVDGNYAVDAKGDVGVKGAKKAVIEIENEVTLKCGSATVTLKSSGDVVIKGGKLVVQGSGNVTIKGSKVGIN